MHTTNAIDPTCTCCFGPQIQELEALCGAQQNSLEEAEERFRALSDAHDALRHQALTAKAQLVTAQAQVRLRQPAAPAGARTALSGAAPPCNAAQRLWHARASWRTKRHPSRLPWQVGELRNARDELAAEAAGLQQRAAALRGEVDAACARWVPHFAAAAAGCTAGCPNWGPRPPVSQAAW